MQMGLRHIIPGKSEYTRHEIDALNVSDNAKERLRFDADANTEGKVIVITPPNDKLEIHGKFGLQKFLVLLRLAAQDTFDGREISPDDISDAADGRIFDYGFTP